ncbi:MAG: hypothetical protein WC378_00280 [Opitutaceae bacterium]|jgi:hypothetical protein
MTCDEYKAAAIRLFRDGNPTDEQWDEMAEAVLAASENHDATPAIDRVIMPEEYTED